MRLLKKAQCSLTLGGPDSGWRPQGAAPYKAETRKLNLEIRGSDEGFLLVSIPDNGGPEGDTWHQSMEEAVSQAESQFGVRAAAWQDVPA
jgi:hypothetical protein